MSVLLETSVGDLVIDLFTDEAPLTTKNFLKLCKSKYYNFSIVHRIERGFVVQMGDPTGTGQGGESIFGVLGGSRYFPPEILPLRKHRRGTVSMASSSSSADFDTKSVVAGSQFFITLSDGLDYLDGKHAVFGEVAEGWDTVDKMDRAICDDGGRPLSDILVRHTIILHDPFPDPSGLPTALDSPLLPSIEQQEMMRIEAGDIIELEEDEDNEVKEGRRRKQEAKTHALTLEMIGDLPYADVKPPDNILFVCKLNQITRDDDLETIFARFGSILSCEIVRDQRTGDSLGYAFIEFESKEACEEAYFKMDNVLIDDRRIHVDFSQSVSRINGKWVRTTTATSGADDSGRPKVQMRQRYRDDVSLGKGDRSKQSFGFVFEAPPRDVASDGSGDGRSERQRTHREHYTGRSRSRWDRTDRNSSKPGDDQRRRSSRSPPDQTHTGQRRRSRFDR
ncbi:Peptidyl-prolyl cis-trans isomerase-like 4 [Coemansia erecta]|nr:Peptidyl-prolyl cis-trans isomerase-like 4 [Coemansia erecta]